MTTHDLSREFSLRTITALLVQRGLLTDLQARQALEREPALRAEILKSKVSGLDARRASRHTVGPTEVLARQEFRTPDGRVLDEDLIMMTLAGALGIAFEKPDPLKLDAELITSTMKQAYARRHSCVPLRREDGKVVLAVSDPSDRQMLETLGLAMPGGYQMVLSAKADIQRIITEVYGFRSSVSAAAEQHGGGVDIGNLEQLSRMQNVEKLEATDEPIDLLVTDVIMPGMNGAQLHQRFRESRPGLRALFVSGYADDVITRHGVVERQVPFLQKPFSLADLGRAVDSLLTPCATDLEPKS